MEDIVTLQEEFLAVKEQLSVVASKLQRDGLCEETEMILRQEKVLLLQDKHRIEDKIEAHNSSNAVTQSGIYRCMESVYVISICICELRVFVVISLPTRLFSPPEVLFLISSPYILLPSIEDVYIYINH